MKQNKSNQDSLVAGNHLTVTFISLFEGSFFLDWLMDLTGMRAFELLQQLQGLSQKGWIAEDGPGIYRFSDLNVRQQWRQSLSREEKESLHSKIAAIIVKNYPDAENKDSVDIGLLKPHFLEITNDLGGCKWLIEAGNWHTRNFEIKEGLKCYLKVLDDLESKRGPELDRLYCEAAIKFSKCCTGTYTSKVISLLEKAIFRAHALKEDQHILALLHMHIAKNKWLQSSWASALEHFETGRSLVELLNDPKLTKKAADFVPFFLHWQGRFMESVQYCEKYAPDIENHPEGRFPLLAAMTKGICYIQCGLVTQGLGMLDSLRSFALEQGDRTVLAHIEFCLGIAMINLHHIDDSIRYLKSAIKKAHRESYNYVEIIGYGLLALSYYLANDNKNAIDCLKKYLKFSNKENVTIRHYPYLLALCWAMEENSLAKIEGLSIDDEIQEAIEGRNIYMRGMAFRYQALLGRKRGQPHEQIISSLELSSQCLTESGQQLEQARTQLEIARQHLLAGNEELAAASTENCSNILLTFNESLIPDDLRPIAKHPTGNENLFKHILKMGQEVVTYRENRELINHIISAVNRLTGAERGAIFLVSEGNPHPDLMLRGSRNITMEQISDPNFVDSIDMIKEVALSGKGCITNEPSSSTRDIIRSRICVPMILKNKVMGVLYHDNRLFCSAFKESDIELLTYFATLAAFALDNAAAYEKIHVLNQKLQDENKYYEEQHLFNMHFDEIIGRSPSMLKMLSQIEQVASTDATVLILGETGVGKELVARAIHNKSPRSGKSFIGVQCSALSDSLIPSELFGHERGSFTGAVQRRVGRFELADQGTIFLDEIGDISLDIQIRLLRVIQSREFVRVGGTKIIRSDFRLLAATNRDLEQKIQEGSFRADLFYRLNVFPITVPPLRERKEDIPLLANHFLGIYNSKLGKGFKGIQKKDIEKLMEYHWPGNVRELENIIERSVILSSGPDLRLPEPNVASSEPEYFQKSATMKGAERRHILWALQKTGWKVRGAGGAAELLDLPASTLRAKMKKFNINRALKAMPADSKL